MGKSADTTGGRRPRLGFHLSLRRGLALTLLVNGLLAAWILLHPVTGRAFVNVDFLLQCVGGVLGGVFCFLPLGARGERLGRERGRAALLCGLGVLAYAAGQVYLTGYRLVCGTDTPAPSPADLFDLLSYPLMLAGLLGLPARRLPPAARLRITLDGLMVLTAVVTFSWRFVLGPFCLQSHQSLATKIVNVGYPVGDLILVLCLLLIAARNARPEMRWAVALLASGLLVVVATDTAETYKLLHGGYISGTLLDIGWSLGYMPVGLAVASLCRRKPDEAGADADRPPPVWLSLLPYTLLPAVGLLVAGTRHLPGAPALEHGVWLGAVLLVGLVLARQVSSILENGHLNGSLRHAYADLAAGEARYRQMFESNPHSMWVYDVETHAILAANEAAVQSYGYTQAEFLALTIEDLRPPEEREELRGLVADGDMQPFYRHTRAGRHRTKDGRLMEVEITASSLLFGGVPARMVLAQDITGRLQLESERERHLALTEGLLSEAVDRADRDPLTNLWNHRAFHRRLEEEIDRTQRGGDSLAVVMLDLDNFKFFNDAYGHAAGDDVLRSVAEALCGTCRSYDTLARFGGDEFALLMPLIRREGDAGPEAVPDTLAGIHARLSEGLDRLTFLPPGHDCAVPLAVSFGVALFPQEAASRADVLPLADERLFRAKSGGLEDGEAERLRRHLLSSVGGYLMLDALLAAVDNKDRYTRRHSDGVLAYSLQIARDLGLGDEAQQVVAVAALLHDVGKIGVPNAVLRKPGRLTDDEFEAIKQHPMMGAVIVGAVPSLEDTLDAIRHHHERWDGGGYPFGLRGEETPLVARLMAVADAFSAMTTDRPYRAGMDEGQALGILQEGAGTQWDPACVGAFLRARRPEAAAAEGPPRLTEARVTEARAA